VSLDGRAIGHDVLLGTSDIEAGELAAARLAAHQVGGKHLTILTDSRAAIAAFHNPTRASSSLAARQAMGLRAEARRRPVELRWVGAHRGHQLNEAADRLAVAARRAYEAGLPAEAAGGLLGGIVADIAAGLLEAGQESVR
jgi:hypothetical protein